MTISVFGMDSLSLCTVMCWYLDADLSENLGKYLFSFENWDFSHIK